MRLPCPAWLTAIGLLGPALAKAAVGDDMLRLDLEAGYAAYWDDGRHDGVFGTASVGFVLGPSWLFRAGHTFASLGDVELHRPFGAARFQLDVFELVPWLEVQGGWYAPSGSSAERESSPGFAFGVGFDWLVDEAWSVGFGFHYHRLVGEDGFPAFLDIGTALTRRWILGDPYAP